MQLCNFRKNKYNLASFVKNKRNFLVFLVQQKSYPNYYPLMLQKTNIFHSMWQRRACSFKQVLASLPAEPG